MERRVVLQEVPGLHVERRASNPGLHHGPSSQQLARVSQSRQTATTPHPTWLPSSHPQQQTHTRPIPTPAVRPQPA
eukprot:2821617-Pyramimonas_sp.AAC.1